MSETVARTAAQRAVLDTDAVLAEGLAAAHRWECAEIGSRAEGEAAERVSACLFTLDDALRHGAALPAAWRQAAIPAPAPAPARPLWRRYLARLAGAR